MSRVGSPAVAVVQINSHSKRHRQAAKNLHPFVFNLISRFFLTFTAPRDLILAKYSTATILIPKITFWSAE